MSRRIEVLTMTGPIAGKLGGAQGVLDAALCPMSKDSDSMNILCLFEKLNYRC